MALNYTPPGGPLPPPPTRGMAKRTYEVRFRRGQLMDLLSLPIFILRSPVAALRISKHIGLFKGPIARWIVLCEWSDDSPWGQLLFYEPYEEFGDENGGNFMLGMFTNYERIQQVDLHWRPFGGDKVVLHLSDWVSPLSNRLFPAEKMYLWVRDGSQFVADLRAELAKVPR
jgi:hypothetical protein